MSFWSDLTSQTNNRARMGIMAFFYLLISFILLDSVWEDQKSISPDFTSLIIGQRVIDHLNRSLSASPLASVQQIQKGKKCPEGMSLLKLGNFEGVKEGKVCPVQYFEEDLKLKTNKCSSYLKNVSQVPEKPLFQWEKDSEFCGQFVEPGKYEYIYVNQTCPDQMKKCNDRLCIDIKLDCPIFSMFEFHSELSHKITKKQKKIGKKLSHKAPNQPQLPPKQGIAFEKNLLQFNDGAKHIILSSTALNNSQPFIGITYGFGEALCFDPLVAIPFPSGRAYPLTQYNFTKGCGLFGAASELDQVLTQQAAQNFYLNNQQNLSLDKIPEFLSYYWHEGDKVNLMGQKRFPTDADPSCYSGLDSTLTQRILKEVTDYRILFYSFPTGSNFLIGAGLLIISFILLIYLSAKTKSTGNNAIYTHEEQNAQQQVPDDDPKFLMIILSGLLLLVLFGNSWWFLESKNIFKDEMELSEAKIQCFSKEYSIRMVFEDIYSIANTFFEIDRFKAYLQMILGFLVLLAQLAKFLASRFIECLCAIFVIIALAALAIFLAS